MLSQTILETVINALQFNSATFALEGELDDFTDVEFLSDRVSVTIQNVLGMHPTPRMAMAPLVQVMQIYFAVVWRFKRLLMVQQTGSRFPMPHMPSMISTSM